MRLIRQVERLEGATVAAARQAKAVPVGVCWVAREERIVDPGELAPGEYIAADVYVQGHAGEAPVVKVVERATRDDFDLGDVYAAGPGWELGERIGRVMSIEGTLVGWEIWREIPPVPAPAA